MGAKGKKYKKAIAASCAKSTSGIGKEGPGDQQVQRIMNHVKREKER